MVDYGYGAAIAALIVALIVWPIVIIVFYVLGSLGLQKIFAKAAVRTPAVAWIPVYNILILSKLADLSPWVWLIGIGVDVVLGWIPFIGWIFSLIPLALTIVTVLRVNQKLGKEPVGFTIFGTLLFPIWALVVGYGQTQPWRTGDGVLARPFWHSWGAFFQDATTWGGVPFQGYPVIGGSTPPAAPPAAPPPPPPAA